MEIRAVLSEEENRIYKVLFMYENMCEYFPINLYSWRLKKKKKKKKSHFHNPLLNVFEEEQRQEVKGQFREGLT